MRIKNGKQHEYTSNFINYCGVLLTSSLEASIGTGTSLHNGHLFCPPVNQVSIQPIHKKTKSKLLV